MECNSPNFIESGTFAQVAENADVLILAVKGDAAESTMALLPAAAIDNKIVIDTNPMDGKLPISAWWNRQVQ